MHVLGETTFSALFVEWLKTIVIFLLLSFSIASTTAKKLWLFLDV